MKLFVGAFLASAFPASDCGCGDVDLASQITNENDETPGDILVQCKNEKNSKKSFLLLSVIAMVTVSLLMIKNTQR